MKKNILYTVVLFSTITLNSCKLSQIEPSYDLIIENGQSFGECIGACYQVMEIYGNDLAVDFSVRSNKNGSKAEERYIDEISEMDRDAIFEVTDFDAFKGLNEVYGCPDCADGGAEWIKISQNGESHMVTFEYGNSVKGLENLILLLRNKRVTLSKKYVIQN